MQWAQSDVPAGKAEVIYESSAEPACDLAVLMREWVSEMLESNVAWEGNDRCEYLVQPTGEPKQALLE